MSDIETTMRTMLAAAALGVATVSTAAASDERAPAPSPPPGAVIMNLLAKPMESQEAAFRESIRQEVARGAAPGTPNDGTIRIGRATLTVTVKDRVPRRRAVPRRAVAAALPPWPHPPLTRNVLTDRPSRSAPARGTDQAWPYRRSE